MSADPEIELHQLSKNYSADPLAAFGAVLLGARAGSGVGARALRGIDLSIRAGERVGVIGANGAGKSTLLGVIAGIAQPTGGSCKISGRVTAVLTLGVGMREDLSGRENIRLALEMREGGRGEADALMQEAIDFTELGDMIDAPLRTYSTGMKARLAFASLVHGSPDILVIDEALSVGDAFFAGKASRKLRELCGRGRIAVIVSHSMESLVSLCERCVWLHQGEVRMDGLAKEVTEAYLAWVRSHDEQELLRRYGQYQHSLRLDPRLQALQLSAGSVASAPLLKAGEDLVVRASLSLAAAVGHAHAHVSLARLDGLVLAEERYPADREMECAGGGLRIEATIKALPLADGTYLAKFELHAGNALLGRASAPFEVRTGKALVGGRPALHAPAGVEAVRVGDEA